MGANIFNEYTISNVIRSQNYNSVWLYLILH